MNYTIDGFTALVVNTLKQKYGVFIAGDRGPGLAWPERPERPEG